MIRLAQRNVWQNRCLSAAILSRKRLLGYANSKLENSRLFGLCLLRRLYIGAKSRLRVQSSWQFASAANGLKRINLTVKLLTNEEARRPYLRVQQNGQLQKRPSRMEANMSRVHKIPDVQWYLVQFLFERLDKIRIRNAFADARRAQAARLLAQQDGPPFDSYRGRITRPHESGNAATGR